MKKKYLFKQKSYNIVANIEIDLLIDSGIKGIILDLDNTIVSEDDRYLSPHAEKWIQDCKLKGLRFYILSNGSRKTRANNWSARLDIPCLSPAKKPFPFAFYKAFAYLKLKPHQIVVIGDSFHTDVLGSFFVGCPCIQVASLPHAPRWWEKLVGKWIQKSYSSDDELWELEN